VNKINLVFAISILLLTSTFMTSFAYAQTSKGLPFDELWKILTQIQQKLVITQTNNQDTILQLKMVENPSNPPFVITNANNENIFTVFPDGTVKLGAHSVVIDPNTGTSAGLRVGAENIPDNTIQSNHIGSNQIKGTHIGNKEIGKDHINDKAIGREKLEDKAVGRDQVDHKAIGREHMSDKAIGHDQIDDKAIGKDKINDKAVGREQLEDKAVGRDQIDNAAIGSDQLAEGSVTSFHILDGTIIENDISPNLFALKLDFDLLADDVTELQNKVDKKPLVTPIGTDAFANSNLILPDDGNIFKIFGTNGIDGIEPKEAGVIVILEFQDDAFNDGVTNCNDFSCAEDVNLLLSKNLPYSRGDTLVLYSDGTYWHEISRSIDTSDIETTDFVTTECDDLSGFLDVDPHSIRDFTCHVQHSALPADWQGTASVLLMPPSGALPINLDIRGYEIIDSETISFEVANTGSSESSIMNDQNWIVTLFETND